LKISRFILMHVPNDLFGSFQIDARIPARECNSSPWRRGS
jgi:hypothetical protein